MTRFGYVLLVSFLALSSGCAAGPGTELQQRYETTRREQQPDLLVRRARTFAAAGDYTRAEQYLTLALQGGARGEEVVPLLVEVCVRDQRYRAAIQHAEQHLRKHPRAHGLRFLKASLLAAVGDVAQARTELERVIKARSAHAGAHFALAVLLRDQLGNHSQADRHFREYLRLAPAGAHAEEANASLLEVMP